MTVLLKVTAEDPFALLALGGHAAAAFRRPALSPFAVFAFSLESAQLRFLIAFQSIFQHDVFFPFSLLHYKAFGQRQFS